MLSLKNKISQVIKKEQQINRTRDNNKINKERYISLGLTLPMYRVDVSSQQDIFFRLVDYFTS